MDAPSRFSLRLFLTTHKQWLIIFSLIILVVLVLMTLELVSKQQEFRQHADESAPMACGNSPTDTVIVLDKSPSMLESNKLSLAEKAAKTFVDQLSQDPRNKVALVTFGSKASVDSPFTNNYSSVKSKIDSIKTLSATCIQCGIKAANDLIAGAGNDGQKKVAVLLTDGMPNAIYSSSSFNFFPIVVSEKTAADAALKELESGYAANKASYYTIGLGNDVNADLLKSIATTTGGEYNFSPTADQLSNIYTHISQLIGKGGVTGMVFNDLNGNGVNDTTKVSGSTGEPPLGGWKLNLTPANAGGTSSATTSNQADGSYSFTGICDGTYTLSADSRLDWQQTVPVNPPSYNVTISNGNVVGDKNFGFISGEAEESPTPSPTCTIPECADPPPGCSYQGGTTCSCGQIVCATPSPTVPACGASCSTSSDCAGAQNGCTSCIAGSSGSKTCQSMPSTVNVTVNATMPGVGAGNGNNANPGHTARTGALAIFNAANQQVGTNSASFTYTNGIYTSHVQTNLPPGVYYVKVRLDNTLLKLIPGVQNLKSGENTLATVALIPGDLNANNTLDITDYNAFVSCYGGRSCAQKNLVDFNDDGAVDPVDYNILLRSFATRLGD